MHFSLSLAAFLAAPLTLAAPATVNAKAVGRLFSLNGTVTYFAGTNAWWLGHLTEDADVDTAMSEIAASQEKVVRVWGFGNSNVNDTSSVYYQLINETLPGLHTEINYGSNGIGRLDSVVASAEKYSIGLVLPMLNNWDDLGGINTYCAVFGCNETTFYTNTDAQAAYKNYVKFIVQRYQSSTAVFAWELCNEPRCHGCNSSVIYEWASDISEYIKSLDSSHMVALGDEGWLCSGGDGYAYSCGEGVDFALNLEIPTLDYGTFHLYPDTWGYNESWGNTWILDHDAVGKASGKPIVLEEFGALQNMTYYESQWQETVLTETEIAADQFWQFASPDLSSGTDLGDDYSITYGTQQYQVIGTSHAEKMLAKNVSKTDD
ncbi:putative b-mannanase [Phaeomoniella chlamydospora]|uniref:mannan endo-1,4-beta-mannosidase n=1 Tax=Phaeomoniella chlamydospora TaxID=158046 RepID=A0A0G2GNX9_PHACM|nr:putative b-mannanase [Phaeomoniella chlamydospora]